jgi:hypothetical protein
VLQRYNQHWSGRPADIFSLGAVFAEMWTVLVGKTTDDFFNFRFDQERETAAFRNTLPNVLKWIELLRMETGGPLSHLISSPIYLDIVKRMLAVDPTLRPLASHLVDEIGAHHCCQQELESYVSGRDIRPLQPLLQDQMPYHRDYPLYMERIAELEE